jgi:hypothetical protein
MTYDGTHVTSIDVFENTVNFQIDSSGVDNWSDPGGEDFWGNPYRFASGNSVSSPTHGTTVCSLPGTDNGQIDAYRDFGSDAPQCTNGIYGYMQLSSASYPMSGYAAQDLYFFVYSSAFPSTNFLSNEAGTSTTNFASVYLAQGAVIAGNGLTSSQNLVNDYSGKQTLSLANNVNLGATNNGTLAATSMFLGTNWNQFVTYGLTAFSGAGGATNCITTWTYAGTNNGLWNLPMFTNNLPAPANTNVAILFSVAHPDPANSVATLCILNTNGVVSEAALSAYTGFLFEPNDSSGSTNATIGSMAVGGNWGDISDNFLSDSFSGYYNGLPVATVPLSGIASIYTTNQPNSLPISGYVTNTYNVISSAGVTALNTLAGAGTVITVTVITATNVAPQLIQTNPAVTTRTP